MGLFEDSWYWLDKLHLVLGQVTLIELNVGYFWAWLGPLVAYHCPTPLYVTVTPMDWKLCPFGTKRPCWKCFWVGRMCFCRDMERDFRIRVIFPYDDKRNCDRNRNLIPHLRPLHSSCLLAEGGLTLSPSFKLCSYNWGVLIMDEMCNTTTNTWNGDPKSEQMTTYNWC